MRTKSERIVRRKVDVESILADVQSPSSGGTVVFLGTVRDNSEAGKVSKMVYDAYVPMAEKKLAEIEDDVKGTWPMAKVRIQHRIGPLKIGDVSVVVAVSTPHRAEAFAACRHAIERIKYEAPIWKKEKLADGNEAWVEGHPIGAPRPSGRRPR